MKEITPDKIQPVVRVANYFGVPVGRYWGPRKIPDPELILIVRGRFEYIDAAGQTETLHSGQVLLIEPNVIHTFRRAHGGGRASISCLHCELVPWGQWATNDYRLNPSPRRITSTGRDVTLGSLFETTAKAFTGIGKYQQELVSTLARSIWIRLAEYWTDKPADKKRLSARMEQMTEFLRKRFRDPVTRQDLAVRFGLTPEYVNALFKKELGMAPAEFINRQRVNHATLLLSQKSMTVKQVSEAVGFPDPFYFSKIFKRYTGLPPSKKLP
ncbi:MAG: helix-turn-helix domain-containing protein [Phycisphaerae bacterium]|nr:helix-turn-helix domain-containing protein [Phycisphaerae bacterium]